MTKHEALHVTSFGQDRLWFLQQLEGESVAYSMPAALRVRGGFRADVCDRCMTTIAERHAALRTVFRQTEQGLRQVVTPFARPESSVRDLRELPADERGAAIARLAMEDAARPFDLEAGPLFRYSVLRCADDEHVLLVNMHHIVSDGWSMGVLVSEFVQLYRAYLIGQASPLPPLPLQYVDYARWQREHYTEERMAQALAYWRRELANAPTPVSLPSERTRPPVKSFAGAQHKLSLGLELSAAVRAFARSVSATPFMVLLTAWQILVARLSAQTEVVFGSPIANRGQRELEPLIGFFVNTLALRADFSENPSFREAVAQVRARTLNAYAHQDLPFEKVVEGLSLPRDPARSPLFEVMFILQNTPKAELSLDGLTFTPEELPCTSAKFDVTISLVDHQGDYQGVIEYCTALFDTPGIERLGEQFSALLGAALAYPETRFGDLPLMSEDSRRSLEVDWNATEHPVAGNTILDLIGQRFREQPEADAVRFEGKSWSRGDLDRASLALAQRLAQLGVGPEQLVAVLMDRSFAMVVALLAVLRAGGAYVPIDPEYPAQRIADMLETSAPKLLLVGPGRCADLPAYGGTVLELSEDADTLDGAALQLSGLGLDVRLDPASLAYVIFTSGSTGRPKAAMNTHAGLLNRLNWMQRTLSLGLDDRVLQKTPFSFDVSVWEFFWPMMTGATLVLARPGGHRDASYLVDTIRVEGITTLHFVPSMLQAFLEEPRVSSCISIRTLVCSGEALPPALATRAQELLLCSLYNLYGPTEAAIDVTAWTCPRGKPLECVPLGRPIDNIRVYVLDAAARVVPIGVTGEIHLGGIGLARGYYNRPDLTAERFVPSPFHAGERLYRTGDLGRYRADGTLEYLGRQDGQLKLRGFRIELGDIEHALRGLPGVEAGAVTCFRTPSAELRLAAYWSGSADAGAVRSGLAARLPDYMVPSYLQRLPTLPLSPNGKLDRSGLPAPQVAPREQVLEAPVTETERRVAELFEAVLSTRDVGSNSDFFELGGHSLSATQLTSKVRAALGRELPLAKLFEVKTVRGIASYLDQSAESEDGDGFPAITRRGGSAEAPLSFAQERLWFLEQVEPGLATYSIPGILWLRGALDAERLGRALNTIIERHEALRTCFVSRGDGVSQVVLPSSAPVLTAESCPPGVDFEGYVREQGLVHATEAFDLVAGPLIRFRLLSADGERHALLLAMHHIASDGWSLGVLVRELGQLYRAPDALLPPLPLQYRDYARWQRDPETQRRLVAQLAFWREHLDGAPSILELPADRPRPLVRTHRGGTHALRLSTALSERVEALARQAQATPFMVLLAAYYVLLGKYSGQTDIVVGTPVANRHRTEVAELIGFFVNTLALRAKIHGARRFSELLSDVRAATLGGYEHQDVPFERVVEELRPARDTSRPPLFQAMFVLQNTPATSLELSGLEVALEACPTGTAKFELTLSLAMANGQIAGVLEYNSDLFSPELAARLAAHYARLVELLVERPDARLGAIDLLDAAEFEQVVRAPNLTSLAYPSQASIVDEFERQARAQPGAPAVSDAAQSLTYAEVDARSERVAQLLATRGVSPDELIGVVSERSADTIVNLLGILKAGGAYVPLDPGYPDERLALLLRESGMRLMLAGPAHLERFSSLGLQVVTGQEAFEPAAPPVREPRSIAPEQLAYVMFTSGSTGKPKSVGASHRNVVNLSSQRTYVRLSSGSRVLQHSPLAFDASTFEIWSTLLNGGEVVVAPPGLLAISDIEGLISERGITAAFFTTALFHELVDSGLSALSGLKELLFGGELLSTDHARRALEGLPGCRLVHVYGPTETTTFATFHELSAADFVNGGPVPIGLPLANSTSYVLDDELRPVPRGVVGELFIGGAGVARGYLGQSSLTASKFVVDSFSGTPGQRLYRTGDRCRQLADGALEFMGRVDGQIKIRGFRVELGEVETALQADAAVNGAVCVAVGTSGDKRLVAFVVAHAGAAVDPASLRAQLKARLPAHMVPAQIHVLDVWPLTPTAKIDRQALIKLAASEGPAATTTDYEAPRTPLEQEIAGVWRELLRSERVGLHDNLFDLGAHSLMIVRAHRLLTSRLKRPLSIVDLFRYPSVAALASFLSGELRTDQAANQGASRADARLAAGKRRADLARRRRLPSPPAPTTAEGTAEVDDVESRQP